MTNAEEREDDDLLMALRHLGEGSKLMWLVFISTLTPMLFNGLHSMSYVFITEIPTYWCSVPELRLANWTSEQVRNISSPNACTRYNYNYTHLAELTYLEARQYVQNSPTEPKASSCSSFTYSDTGRSTVVEEWNLVCNRAADRANTFMAFSIGKIIGAGFFGTYADKYGRKRAFVIGVILQIISGPLSAIVPWFYAFMLLRFVTGVSTAAVGSSSFTTLTELCSNRYRQWLGVAFNAGYPVGVILVAGFAYIFPNWRHLQMAISVSSFLLLINAWLMPESPAWLISQGRRKEAQEIVENYYGPISTSSVPMLNSANSEEDASGNKLSDKKVKGAILEHFKGLRVLLSNSELRKRLIIVYICWLASSLSYYVIALNADNFTADRYLYVVVTAITEIPAYIVTSLTLLFLGRRPAGTILYVVGAACLLSILTIPREHSTTIIAVALTGRFALSAVYGIIILYTSELFPTVGRNSAVGTSSVMAYIGTLTAPYIADLLGTVAWWAPSTLCGILAIVAGVFCRVLPETRGRQLADTVEQEVAPGRERTSFRRCLTCRSETRELPLTENCQ